MEYTFLKDEEQYKVLANRLFELEQQHYQNSLLLEECGIVNDVSSAPQFEAMLASLEPRIEDLRTKLEKFNAPEAPKD